MAKPVNTRQPDATSNTPRPDAPDRVAMIDPAISRNGPRDIFPQYRADPRIEPGSEMPAIVRNTQTLVKSQTMPTARRKPAAYFIGYPLLVLHVDDGVDWLE